MKSNSTQFKQISQLYNNYFLLQNDVNTISKKYKMEEHKNIIILKKKTSFSKWSCICALPVLYKDAYYHYYQGQVINYTNHNFLNQTVTIQTNVSHINFFLCIPTQLPNVALNLSFRKKLR
jgi:hypothetical protein